MKPPLSSSTGGSATGGSAGDSPSGASSPGGGASGSTVGGSDDVGVPGPAGGGVGTGPGTDSVTGAGSAAAAGSEVEPGSVVVSTTVGWGCTAVTFWSLPATEVPSPAAAPMPPSPRGVPAAARSSAAAGTANGREGEDAGAGPSAEAARDVPAAPRAIPPWTAWCPESGCVTGPKEGIERLVCEKRRTRPSAAAVVRPRIAKAVVRIRSGRVLPARLNPATRRRARRPIRGVITSIIDTKELGLRRKTE